MVSTVGDLVAVTSGINAQTGLEHPHVSTGGLSKSQKVMSGFLFVAGLRVFVAVGHLSPKYKFIEQFLPNLRDWFSDLIPRLLPLLSSLLSSSAAPLSDTFLYYPSPAPICLRPL